MKKIILITTLTAVILSGILLPKYIGILPKNIKQDNAKSENIRLNKRIAEINRKHDMKEYEPQAYTDYEQISRQKDSIYLADEFTAPGTSKQIAAQEYPENQKTAYTPTSNNSYAHTNDSSMDSASSGRPYLAVSSKAAATPGNNNFRVAPAVNFAGAGKHQNTDAAENQYIAQGNPCGMMSNNIVSPNQILNDFTSNNISTENSDIIASDNLGDSVIDPTPIDLSSSDIPNTPEYKFISEYSEILNNGMLDFSDDETAQVTQLFFEGEAGLNPAPVIIDGIEWSYTGVLARGHPNFPEAWYDGTYHFQLGSGLEGNEAGRNPEPSTIVMSMIGLIPGLLRYIRRKFVK